MGDCTNNIEYLGLELALYISCRYLMPLASLKANSSGQMNILVFGLYLDATHSDEAGKDGIHVEEVKLDTWVYNVDNWMLNDNTLFGDDNTNKVAKKNTLVMYTLELVLLGVDQNHYKGCLTWHEVQSYVATLKEKFSLSDLWEFVLANE